jgi:acyl-CoA synthetase (AMP-forming)/AMP-acid ligase II
MSEENLARQAELARDRQGDHESLFYEGRWHSSGALADRAARFATGLADLIEHGRRHLASYKDPRQVTIVPAVPLTSVGKLDRKKLRQWVADGSAAG